MINISHTNVLLWLSKTFAKDHVDVNLPLALVLSHVANLRSELKILTDKRSIP
jgi:hypothetical protein